MSEAEEKHEIRVWAGEAQRLTGLRVSSVLRHKIEPHSEA